MSYAMKRIEGLCWDRRRCMVVMQSLRLMVLSRVLRRAEVDPPQYLDDCAGSETDADTAASLSSVPLGSLDELSWFTRLFHRRTDSIIHHARHTT
jgi:hypothetical protein